MDANCINSVVFSDEATFMLSGSVNRQLFLLVRYKPSLDDGGTQTRNRFIGPIFTDKSLDFRRYSTCLYAKKVQDEIVPRIKELKPDKNGLH